jgi:hypothetical protein
LCMKIVRPIAITECEDVPCTAAVSLAQIAESTRLSKSRLR